MAKSSQERALKCPKAIMTPVDIRKYLNFPGRSTRNEFLRELAKQVKQFPATNATICYLAPSRSGKNETLVICKSLANTGKRLSQLLFKRFVSSLASRAGNYRRGWGCQIVQNRPGRLG